MKAADKRVTPPLVGLGHLRRAHGYTLQQVCDGLLALTGRRYQPGTISAVEIGADRPGPKLARALVEFYELDGQDHVHMAPRLVPSPPGAAVSAAEDAA